MDSIIDSKTEQHDGDGLVHGTEGEAQHDPDPVHPYNGKHKRQETDDSIEDRTIGQEEDGDDEDENEHEQRSHDPPGLLIDLLADVLPLHDAHAIHTREIGVIEDIRDCLVGVEQGIETALLHLVIPFIVHHDEHHGSLRLHFFLFQILREILGEEHSHLLCSVGQDGIQSGLVQFLKGLEHQIVGDVLLGNFLFLEHVRSKA